MESPFEILQVDSDADAEEIEQAYKRRVIDAHPDQGGSVREFRLVRMAYEQLMEGDASDVSVDVEDVPREGTDGERPEPDAGDDPRTEVTYLDYEAMADYGWDIDDDDLFEKAADADLDEGEQGEIRVDPDEYLLEAAEDCDYTWPFACRGGACANCAVKVTKGDLSLPVNHILPDEMVDEGIRLSCVGTPTTDELEVIYNVKHLPYLDDLRLPPRPFEQAYAND